VLFGGVVQPVANAAAAVTATVGPGGGTVSAGGATLTIPAGALPAAQAITVTPLSSLGGSPFDRLLGGVKLGPDGLTFIKPATLTIQLPPGVDPAQLFGFAFDGSGTDVPPRAVAARQRHVEPPDLALQRCSARANASAQT
jgi:hypothetical protein